MPRDAPVTSAVLFWSVVIFPPTCRSTYSCRQPGRRFICSSGMSKMLAGRIQKLITSSDVLANRTSHLEAILCRLERSCFRDMLVKDGIKTPALFRCGGRDQEPHPGSERKAAHVPAFSQPPDQGP